MIRPMATRREFLGGIASTALLGSCAAPAAIDRAGKGAWRVGWLSGNATESVLSLSAPFIERLRQLGYALGRDLVMEWQIADTKNEQLPAEAAALAALSVDVIVAEAQPAQVAARDATKNIPIVFVTSTDPVGEGLVASFAHPGGNITGVTTGSIPASSKRVELLHESMPSMARLAVLWNRSLPSMANTLVPATVDAARALGVEVKDFAVQDLKQLDSTLADIARDRFDALIVLPALSVVRDQLGHIPDFANLHRLPQAYADESMVRNGGLMSYNGNRPIQYRRAAEYVDKILKGILPANIPVEDPSQFDLILNQIAANKLSISFPPSLLSRATAIIR
jgi:putative ABC transport system substrate-binding protein